MRRIARAVDAYAQHAKITAKLVFQSNDSSAVKTGASTYQGYVSRVDILASCSSMDMKRTFTRSEHHREGSRTQPSVRQPLLIVVKDLDGYVPEIVQ